jgi:hypothetical protein
VLFLAVSRIGIFLKASKVDVSKFIPEPKPWWRCRISFPFQKRSSHHIQSQPPSKRLQNLQKNHERDQCSQYSQWKKQTVHLCLLEVIPFNIEIRDSYGVDLAEGKHDDDDEDEA